MRAFTVGRVAASRSAEYGVDDVVTGMFGWQDYAVVDGSKVQRRINEVDLPVSTALGVLGLNGLTAYFALLDLGQPKAKETVVVSTAAGAVGSCVGQIAKIKGCRTIGIAGGPKKTELCVNEFGYEVAIDYRVGNLEAEIAQACPNGIDVYFDNTAGEISDSVLKNLAVGALSCHFFSKHFILIQREQALPGLAVLFVVADALPRENGNYAYRFLPVFLRV